MPNPHFDVRIISRGGGKSAVASASYRSGSKLTAHQGGRSVVASASYRSGEQLWDERAGKSFDYTRKEDVLHKEILTPAQVPPWSTDRERLWNQVETVEKRKDAQLARDIIAALPRELEHEQHVALIRAFVTENFTAKGMIADIALHDKRASDGGTNPHAHIMLTLREVDATGFGKKNRDWNKLDLVSHWRASWEEMTNQYLATNDREERVNLQSLEARGIERTPEKHMGADAWNLEAKGTETHKGNQNRHIRHDNNLRDIAVSYAPEPTAPEPAVPEPVIEARPTMEVSNLRQASQALAQPPPEAQSVAPHLGQVSTDLVGNEGSNTVDAMDARTRHTQIVQAMLATSIHRTLQVGGELINRVRMATRHLVEKAMGQDREDAGAIFDQYSHLGDLATTQKKDREHER